MFFCIYILWLLPPAPPPEKTAGEYAGGSRTLFVS